MHKLLAAGLAVLIGLHQTAAFGWGAIAVDHDFGEDPEDSGYVMVAQGHPTAAGAAGDALASCSDNGDHCEVVLTFRKCGAYAASRTQFGVGAGTTLRQAEGRAVAACKSRSCRIVVSDCE